MIELRAKLRRFRARLAVLAVGGSAAAASIACTAGDLEYSSIGSTADGGAVTGADGAGGGFRADGGALITVPSSNGGGIVPSTRTVTCSGLDPDGGCDPSAGSGCCLAASSTTSVNDNTCVDQGQHFGGTACMKTGDVFLACLGSTADSLCCWQPETDGRMDTRYRSDCDGGVEACDPLADGGSCSNGAVCTPKTCKGVTVGYCGAGAAPCAE